MTMPQGRCAEPHRNGLSRRHLLKGALASGAVTLASQNRTEASTSLAPKPIDAHSHIWSRDVKTFPLTQGSTLADLDPGSFTTAQLQAVMKQHGVGRAVLIQHHIYHGYDNSYLVHAARSHPEVFRVVAMVNDLKPAPAQAMRRLLKSGATGFRITSWIRKQDWLKGPGMEAMWKCGAETGQAICCLIDPPDLAALDAMCTRHPATPVVIDHFARIGVDGTIKQRDISNLCHLARHKNTQVKLSAYYALGAKKPPYRDLLPMIRRVLDAFGPSRCMWASDSPYQIQGTNTYAASLALISEHCDFLSSGDRDNILWRTAERVYFQQSSR